MSNCTSQLIPNQDGQVIIAQNCNGKVTSPMNCTPVLKTTATANGFDLTVTSKCDPNFKESTLTVSSELA